MSKPKDPSITIIAFGPLGPEAQAFKEALEAGVENAPEDEYFEPVVVTAIAKAEVDGTCPSGCCEHVMHVIQFDNGHVLVSPNEDGSKGFMIQGHTLREYAEMFTGFADDFDKYKNSLN